MNNSIALSTSPLGSMAIAKNEQYAIDPFIFIDNEQPEIIHRLTREYEYSGVDADQFFLFLKEILTNLKKLRLYKVRTFDYIEDTIKSLPVKIRLFTILLLLKPIITEDAWMHSYNFLAHLANRDIPVPLELKSIPEYKLVAMIEKEGDNPLIFPDHVLNGFHVVFIDGFIWASTDVKSFKDWFRMVPRGKPIIKEEMITYFCYAVSLLDEYRDKEICPNMEDWYSALTGKKTLFSKLKGNAVGPNKNEVDRRMEHFTRFLNG